MSEKPGDATKSGLTFGSMLALLFIGLKLGGVIDWSWWWVLAPLWLPFAVIMCLLAIFLLGWGAVQIWKAKG